VGATAIFVTKTIGDLVRRGHPADLMKFTVCLMGKNPRGLVCATFVAETLLAFF
jgi:hypothetical protein